MPSPKKFAVPKASAKASTKASAKKAATKKPASAKKAVHASVHESVPTQPVQKIIYQIQKRFVFVPKCSNCDHVPMRINGLVALMTILVAMLSGMVIAQSQPARLVGAMAQAASSTDVATQK
ncbi:hypothetical protein HZA85_00955 [Candidatus Uhrbacteria bacterium]|nr:hypothetical protein [Candidatus Uhrbacteria bacterium]